MAVSFVKDFLEQHTCYDLLPVNNKVVVVDVELSLKKALQILLQNGKFQNLSVEEEVTYP